MIRRFEVVYRVGPASPLLTVTIEAGSESEALSLLPPDLEFRRAHEVAPLLSPGQTTFDREGAALYMNCTPSKIDVLMATGDLPKAKGGRPIFTKRMLDACIAKTMQVRLEEVA